MIVSLKFVCCMFYALMICIKVDAWSLTPQEKILFWSKPKKGAVMMNHDIDIEDIQAAKSLNVKFVKLMIDYLPAQKRDFLVGNADEYSGLVREDLNFLTDLLESFHKAQMPVVLSISTLPGSRNHLKNNGKQDLRIWTLERYQRQAARFLKDLMKEVRNHPAVVGVNILHRPMPERFFSKRTYKLYEADQDTVQQVLYNVYHDLILNIRKVDKDIKIILDSSAGGDPNAFRRLMVHNVPGVIYSFHMYEPSQYTSSSDNGRFIYPGTVGEIDWDKEALRSYMRDVKKFQITHNIDDSQILVGGFGCNRFADGIAQYLEDLTEIFNESNWHTTFSDFRSDIDDGMDYEIGNEKLPWSYYQAKDSGLNLKPIRNSENPIFQVVKGYLMEQ